MSPLVFSRTPAVCPRRQWKLSSDAVPTATPLLTVSCPVRFSLSDGEELDASLYLPTDQSRPGGCASVEDVLDGGREFVPIGLESGSALIRRSAILCAEVSAEERGAPDLAGEGGTFDVVTLRLDSGREVSGILRTFAPTETMRMSDVFNRPDRFLAVSSGDRILLVSKARIVLASF